MNSSANSSIPTKEQICKAPLETTFIIQASVLILIMIVTFIGNLLVLLAVIFFRRLRSITNYFIFSLAVSDLLISLLSLPFRIDQNFHNASWCASMLACQVWLIIDSTCTFASMWNLAIISIDRFLAINKPFRYQSIMTNRVGFGLISFVWIYSTGMALLMLLNWTQPGQAHFNIEYECTNRDPIYYTVAVSLSFFLPLLIIVVMYGMVFEVALNQTRAMAALQVHRETNRGIGNPINLIREVKAAKTLAVVIGCFLVCWLPFNIIFMILLWSPKLILDLHDKVKLFLSMLFIYLLPALNSTMNPVIYALLNREFRSAFGKLAKRMTGRHLGAIGLNGTLDSTTGGGASHAEQSSEALKDHDRKRSENSAASPSEDLLLYNTRQTYKDNHEPIDSNLKVFDDTNSMETSLDYSKRPSVENNNDASSSNGHVLNNQLVSSDVVNDATNNHQIADIDDVIDDHNVNSNVVNSSDVISNENICGSDDVTVKEDEKSFNVKTLSPQGSPLQSPSKTSSLPPIEQTNPIDTENDTEIASPGIKSFTVQPSPKLPIKGDGNDTEL